jgi:hypothetical protein
MRYVFWGVVALLLGVLAWVQISSIRLETQTWDEGIHLSAGYSYWKTGDYRLNREHPPLFKLLAALPLLPFNPVLPLDDPSWRKPDQPVFGDKFLYRNRVPADVMLFRARLVTIGYTLALGLVLALWVRSRFGAGAALFALLLYCFDPNIIAHGRYVTNDLLVSLTLFLAVITWVRYLETLRMRDLLLAAVCLGLALLSKFSAVFIVGVLFALYLFRRWQAPALSLPFKRLAGATLVLVLVAAALISAAYGPRYLRGQPPLNQAIGRTTIPSKVLRVFGKVLRLPAHPYLVGLNDFVEHNRDGHPAYLFGMRSDEGWWYYFPVVFAVKSPTAVLLLCLVCLPAGAWWAFRRRRRLRDVPLAWAALILPAAVYFALCLDSRIDIGVRHLLPLYPFLYGLLAAIVFHDGFRRPRAALVSVAAALLLVESIRVYPDYLAFFNSLAGGPGNGPRYLVDSNLDWGQDVKKLHSYVSTIAPSNEHICVSYFGRADMLYYGVEYRDLPNTDRVAREGRPDCIVAISATLLAGVYVNNNEYRWLRAIEPTRKVGYSIYVYDFRKQRKR